MPSKLYLETSIFGYLAMRMSNVLRIAATQQVTHEFWSLHRERYELYVSRYVIDECAAGDAVAAAERALYLRNIPLLDVGDDAIALTNALMSGVPLPAKANVDAYHISVATVHGIEYVLTWNCRHIANPALRPRIEAICRSAGYEPPVICTPFELMEINDEF